MVLIFTVRNEVAKVIFIQVCVCPHGGWGVVVSQHALQQVSKEGGVFAIPACIVDGIPACLATGLEGGCLLPGGYLFLEGMLFGGCLLLGGWRPHPHPHPPPPPPKADGYCCRRYTSYWNAFLFRLFWNLYWQS